MARNTADDCMFCGLNHAGNCGGKKPKPTAQARPKLSPQTKPPVAPAPQVTGATPASKVGPSVEQTRVPAPPPAATGRPNLASVARVKDADEEALAYAVTCFAEQDMLHRDTLEELRHLVRLPDWKIRAMIWRQDNAAVQLE